MRWEGLFADLEGQLAAERRRERDDEVAERTRRERALVSLSARLTSAVGGPVALTLIGSRRVEGDLQDLGEDWLLVLDAADRRELLVPTAAVTLLRSLGAGSAPVRERRRFRLGYALRALSRDRATVSVTLLGGAAPLLGTIDTVGADHLDLAEHDAELPRRRENVRSVVTVPFAAIVAVESRR